MYLFDVQTNDACLDGQKSIFKKLGCSCGNSGEPVLCIHNDGETIVKLKHN